MQHLDTLSPIAAQVGYGDLGVGGGLGYEGKTVRVARIPYMHALSTHAPARLRFALGGAFAGFHCQVALNDDVPPGRSYAHFLVFGDGRRLATAPYVVAGEPPRPLSADLRGVEILELVVETARWEFCHAVWLDPRVDDAPAAPAARELPDPLNRAVITLPAPSPQAQRCIATVVSPGFGPLLDDMLGSLRATAQCREALLAVFAVAGDDACARIAAKHEAILIPCRPQGRINSTVKSVLYAVARVIDAQQFICLDADMLVLDDLRPLFAALEVAPPSSILACREANSSGLHNLDHAIHAVYGGRPADLSRLLGRVNGEGSYPLVVNDGTFAGDRLGMLALDGLIRGWPQAAIWVDERRDVWWRNQFIFNLALAHLQCGVELDPVYNIQLNSQEVSIQAANAGVQAIWHDESVRVLHFNGNGRHKYPQWRGVFAQAEVAEIAS